MNILDPQYLEITDHLLTTTRSVRKRLDFSRPVEPEIIQRCIEIAIQAPSGSNRQGWHFMIVSDAAKKKAIGDLYLKSFLDYARQSARAAADTREHAPTADTQKKVAESAMYLARHMHEAPLLVIPCIEGRTDKLSSPMAAGLYGSILPAAWSLMLALRARGLGSAWTTLHLVYEKEAAEILGIPEHITQAALLPVAYFTGEDFKAAERIPATEITYWDGWGQTR
ncbi:MAG: nitroreductase family protein [Caldilineaceae bacterium]